MATPTQQPRPKSVRFHMYADGVTCASYHTTTERLETRLCDALRDYLKVIEQRLSDPDCRVEIKIEITGVR